MKKEIMIGMRWVNNGMKRVFLFSSIIKLEVMLLHDSVSKEYYTEMNPNSK